MSVACRWANNSCSTTLKQLSQSTGRRSSSCLWKSITFRSDSSFPVREWPGRFAAHIGGSRGPSNRRRQLGHAGAVGLTTVSAVASLLAIRATSCDGAEVAGGDVAQRSPFVYAELQQAIGRRVVAQHALVQYMRSMQQVIGALQMQLRSGGLGPGDEGTELYWTRMREMQTEVANRSQEIVYGVKDPGARARYEEQFGCVRWTQPALRAVAAHSPLIEIGAGAGHWQRELTQLGADILAFDNGAEVPLPQAGTPVGVVLPGDHSMIGAHSQRTLFLCYPPADSMALDCLAIYRGEVLLYVGEGRGGVNGTAEFFDMLEREWYCEEIVPLEPFPECFERLFVLRRRKYG